MSLIETKVLLLQESIFAKVGEEGAELHIRRFRHPAKSPHAAALLLHGAIENGRIFYSASGYKGLAPYLAHQGYDVYVGDLRGRGLSRPRLSRQARYGQTEAITEDLTTLVETASQHSGRLPQHWLAHSWGGVLMASHLVRTPANLRNVKSLTFFGTKRRITVHNRQKFIGIDVIWNRAAFVATALYGYLPARKMRLGSDDETKLSHAHSVTWVDPQSAWIDPVDAFDYGAAAQVVELPRALFLAGPQDAYLGHPVDVRLFARECGVSEASVHVLSRDAGHLADYGHVDMLTHPKAELDHFPLVAHWLETGRRPGQKRRHVECSATSPKNRDSSASPQNDG